MKIVEKSERKSNAKSRVEAAMKIIEGRVDLDSRLLLIQQLIPIGLMAVEEVLQTEVSELARQGYQRDENPNKRRGSNIGSVNLGGQKHSISVPGVRNQKSRQEVPLKSYRVLQANQGDQSSEIREGGHADTQCLRDTKEQYFSKVHPGLSEEIEGIPG